MTETNGKMVVNHDAPLSEKPEISPGSARFFISWGNDILNKYITILENMQYEEFRPSYFVG